MHKAEGFVPHECVSGTKSSSVSPFPEGRDLGRGERAHKKVLWTYGLRTSGGPQIRANVQQV